MSTITITFSEAVENHNGMQIIGQKAESGFSMEELQLVVNHYEKLGKKIEIHDLNPLNFDVAPVCIIIVRNALDDDLYKGVDKDLNMLKPLMDTKALIRGRVVNKIARWNLCLADEDQSPDYENGKGRVVDFKHVPSIDKLRNDLSSLFTRGLFFAELNYYYNIKKCYIGEHGDTERFCVVGFRMGSPMDLSFRWFHRHNPVSEKQTFMLNSGDLYFMSELATGYNWKKSSLYTLRHSAGL